MSGGEDGIIQVGDRWLAGSGAFGGESRYYNDPVTDPSERDRPAGVTLARDTTPEATRLQVELWRGMTPLQKARLVGDVTRATQRLSLAGIRQRHPGASEREVWLRLVILTLGPALARQAYPEAAALLDPPA